MEHGRAGAKDLMHAIVEDGPADLFKFRLSKWRLSGFWSWLLILQSFLDAANQLFDFERFAEEAYRATGNGLFFEVGFSAGGYHDGRH